MALSLTLMINHYWKNYNSGIYLQWEKGNRFFKNIYLWNIFRNFYKNKKNLQIFLYFKGRIIISLWIFFRNILLENDNDKIINIINNFLFFLWK